MKCQFSTSLDGKKGKIEGDFVAVSPSVGSFPPFLDLCPFLNSFPSLVGLFSHSERLFPLFYSLSPCFGLFSPDLVLCFSATPLPPFVGGSFPSFWCLSFLSFSLVFVLLLTFFNIPFPHFAVLHPFLVSFPTPLSFYSNLGGSFPLLAPFLIYRSVFPSFGVIS